MQGAEEEVAALSSAAGRNRRRRGRRTSSLGCLTARLRPLLPAALLLTLIACTSEPSPAPIAAPAEKPNAAGAMVDIPAGAFLMGANDGDPGEAPLRRVELAAFAIDRTPVTEAAYAAWKPSHPIPPGKAEHPVVNVTWEEARAYCRAQGKRLPSEAEWEKAARGTDGRRYPWGEVFDAGRANTPAGPHLGTTPVGAYPGGASVYGVLDMAGNVWEWTADTLASGSAVILKGGSFFNYQGQTDAADIVRSAKRSFFRSDRGWFNVGFRCAR